MNGSRTYLVKVLKRLESRLGSEGLAAEAAVIHGIAAGFGETAVVQDELENLFSVDGLEQLALGLMWVHAKDRIPLNGLQDEVVNYEVEMLRRIFLADPEDDVEGKVPAERRKKPGLLGGALGDFSRLIADLRRRLTGGGKFQGFNEELAWRVLDQLSMLRNAASSSRNQDVEHFCDAMEGFVDYVVRNKIFSDVRVLSIIDNANLTLQTVVGGAIPEEQDSLDQTIELLKHPSTLLKNDRAEDR